MDDDEVKLRAQGVRLDPADGEVYSKHQIEERNRPPTPELDENGDPVDKDYYAGYPEEPGSLPPLLVLDSLVTRVEDNSEQIQAELTHFNANEKAQLDDLVTKMYNNQFLKLDAAGLAPEVIADSCEQFIRTDSTVPLRPIARKLEGAGDLKACLTDPLSEDQPEGALPRQWSLWKNIDPVALFKGKLVPGLPEFAAAYANNMFVFADEPNLNAFLLEPKKYL